MFGIEIGQYKGKTGWDGWDGWVGGKNWISFIRPGEVHTYKRGERGAVVGDPVICKF